MPLPTTYPDDQGRCKDFLQNFGSSSETAYDGKYCKMLQEIADRRRTILEISLDDITQFFAPIDPDFLTNLRVNTYRYVSCFERASDEIMPDPNQDAKFELDIRDRMFKQMTVPPIPLSLKRRHIVVMVPNTSYDITPLRGLRAEHLGQLVMIQGTVSSMSDVKPQVRVCTYRVGSTGSGDIAYTYQAVEGQQFMPLHDVPDDMKNKGILGDITLDSDKCAYEQYQELKIQELPEEVPEGGTPRTMLVRVTGDLCMSVKTGDICRIGALYLPFKVPGFKGLQQGLKTNVLLLCQSIHKLKTSYSDIKQSYNMDIDFIQQVVDSNQAYHILSQSIAPEIYGMEDVKKALLIALVGGVNKTVIKQQQQKQHQQNENGGDAMDVDTDDSPSNKQNKSNMHIRGDIHICLMGDPGVAKSQLLKQASHIAPRAVYTSGKGSSSAGLTVGINRDPISGDVVIEGGALILSDNGICCIDEFDKMQEYDRTAIHEVMEQQTISISKAGISATLNSRSTIIAAANPQYGTYNTNKSPAENIAMPHALMSRFDLLWLLLDKKDEERDEQLALHVLSIHQYNDASRQQRNKELGLDGAQNQDNVLRDGLLTPKQLRTYIAYCKRIDPIIPKTLAPAIAASYVLLRKQEVNQASPGTYTTARTLMSICRIAQALARIRLSETVEQGDIDESLRLLQASKSSIANSGLDDNLPRLDPIAAIYQKIQEYIRATDVREVTLQKVKDICAAFAPTHEQIMACINEYGAIDVWEVVHDAANQPIIVLTGQAQPQAQQTVSQRAITAS